MEADQEKLKEILENNPQVDGELVARVLKEVEEMHPGQNGMVNFRIRLPYSSDNFSRAIQDSWDII